MLEVGIKGQTPRVPPPYINYAYARADKSTSVLCVFYSPISPSTPGLGMLMEVRVSVSSLFLVSPFFPMMYLEVESARVSLTQ